VARAAWCLWPGALRNVARAVMARMVVLSGGFICPLLLVWAKKIPGETAQDKDFAWVVCMCHASYAPWPPAAVAGITTKRIIIFPTIKNGADEKIIFEPKPRAATAAPATVRRPIGGASSRREIYKWRG